MKTRTIIIVALVALAAFAAYRYFNSADRAHSSPPIAAAPSPAPVTPAPAAPAPAVAAVTPPAPAVDTNTRVTEPPAKKTPSTTLRADAKLPKPASTKRTKPPIQDPDARAALADVGVDPVAEAYWIQAINDLSLPAEERKDLIEDLNEDGLIDPKHPRPEDMPIIARRIKLLEGLDAADEVNAKAIAEAYKDLVKLWKGLPVD